jgi:hypothetical protein
MATKKTKAAAPKKSGNPSSGANGPAQMRLWLMYPPKFITTPVIWELGHKFPVMTNVRQASVTDEIGIVCLELSGPRTELKAAIKWLEDKGIKVEPVEIGVIES